MALVQSEPVLSLEEILSLISKEGPFFQIYPYFEVRDEQKSMLQDAIQAFNESKIAMIEAGTGTGKSLAYLLPAILWALKTKERVMITTRTINLQEQLYFKDIPMLKEALGLNFKAVLVKGMGNYVCKRRVKESLEELLLFPSDEGKDLLQIDAWSRATKDGTKKDLPIIPQAHIWEKVAADRDACNKEKCAFHKECFFYNARKEAADAQILVANHSLLLSDLAFREKNGAGLLPDYTRIIIDEAHHLEDVALEHMAETLSFSDLVKIASKLQSEKGGIKSGKVVQLGEKLRSLFKKEETTVFSLLQKINLNLPETKNRLIRNAADAFDELSTWLDIETRTRTGKEEGERRLRLQERHFREERWKLGPGPAFRTFIEAIKSYIIEIEAIEAEISLMRNDKVNEATEGLRLDISSLLNRLRGILQTAEHFIREDFSKDEVRWTESPFKKGIESLRIYSASLDIAKKLSSVLFEPYPTVLLCSATLAANESFDFLKKRLGIYEKPIEKIYLSSFDYPQQALLAVPQDLPSPIEDDYFDAACKMLFEAIKIQPKGVFILSTSFAFLDRAFSTLEAKLKELRFTVFKQGQQSKSVLLKQFKQAPKPVLFATDSFWEGVDVQGGILKLVVITRLPFKVPDEPLVQAMREKILREGGDPFTEDSLPDAIVKFKQGFGRLIRSKKDKGCVLCLDKRIITKPYGKAFLKSLPNCQQQFLPKDELLKAMKRFYYS